MRVSAPVIALAAICLVLGVALVWQNAIRPPPGGPASRADVPSDNELFTTPLPAPPATRPAALDRVMAPVNFDRTPLRAAVKHIADSAQLGLEADWNFLQGTVNVHAAAPVTLRLSGVTHADALAAVLRQVPGLDYRVTDGPLRIVAADGEPDVYVRFYDVRALLRDSISFSAAVKRLNSALPAPPAAGSAGADGSESTRDEHLAPLEQIVVRDLSALLTKTIDPKSWADNGGRGQIHYWAGRLIVSQTDDNHRQIAELLKLLSFPSPPPR